jgi:Peptidase family C25/Propeptide_C25
MRPVLRLLAALPLVLAWVSLARADAIEMVSSDEHGVTLRLTVSGERVAPESDPRAAYQSGRSRITARGLGITDVPGRPLLPYASTLVALPPGADARVRVLDAGAESLRERFPIAIAGKPVFRSEPGALGMVPERERVEPLKDGAWPTTAAITGKPFVIRRQRVVAVTLYPYRYDAGADRLWSRDHMTVRVDFVGGSTTGGGGMPDRHWDAVLREGVVNFDQARGWREPSPARRAGPGRSLFPARPAGATAFGFDESQPEVRVLLDSSAVYQLDFNSLATNGYPAGVPVGEVSVHRHEFLEGTMAPDPCYATIELPIEVDDRDGDGFFDNSDRIYVPIQAWAERSGATTAQRQWGDGEVVYVTRKSPGGKGLRIPVRDGWRGPTALAPLASGPFTERWERNFHYFPTPPDTVQDQFHWTEFMLYYTRVDSFPIELNHLDTSHPISVTVDLEGRSDLAHQSWVGVHRLAGPLSMVMDSVGWYGKATKVTSASFPGTSLTEGGGNALMCWGRNGSLPPDPATNFSDVTGLNWYELTYWRAYKALRNYLRCSSGSANGVYQIHADGFTLAPKDTIRVYDTTDPIAPVRLFVDATRDTNNAGVWSIDFQDSASAANPRSYAVFSRARAVSATNYSAVTRRSIYANGVGDYLLVVPEAFLPAVQPLADLRTSEGLRVLVAPLESINDEFNGGRHSAYSIERFIRRSYDSFDARFVTLVGDGSLDPLNQQGDATPDWVPVRRIIGPVFATGGYEMVPSDQWYVIFGNQDPAQSTPVLPDLFIGRLPVNSLQQANAVVSKLVQYEQLGPDPSWRSKILLSSDDSYSGDSFFGGGGPTASAYCHEPGEDVFHELSDAVATIITSPDSAGLSQTNLTKFYLSYYLRNGVEVPNPPDPNGWVYPGANGDTCRNSRSSVETLVHGNVTPKLLTLLDQGQMWWNFQGHANSTVLTHEDLYVNQNGEDDKDNLTNTGHPFLFSAFSCHANAFAYEVEQSRGPSIGEDLVCLPGGGAIASWASTGFEILPISSTDHINTEWARAMFFKPPQDEYLGDRGSRVVLGETIALALTRYVPRPNIQFFEKGIALTYDLLGDPATRLSIGRPQSVVMANTLPVTDLTPIRLHTVGDTLRLDADLVSTVRLDQILLEHQGAITDTVPATGYTLSPAFPDTAAGSSGGRRYHLTYHTILEPRPSYYRFRTTDRYGVQSTFSAYFEFFTQLRADGVPLADGDPISPTAAMTMLVRSPKPLVPGTDLTLAVNGVDVPFTFQPAPGDPSGREWVLAWAHGPYGIDLYTVVLAVSGGVPQQHTFRVTTGPNDLQLLNVFNFPNPFQEENGTAFSFFLAASGPVDVLIRVFTVGGKLMYERVERGLAPGYHQLPWDGRDAQGDLIANGVYLYKVVATNGSKSQSYTGRLVKLRNPHHSEETATTP